MDSPSQHDETSQSGAETPATPRRRRRIRVRRSWVSRYYRLLLGALVALAATGIVTYSELAHQRTETAQHQRGRALDIPIVPAVLDNDREYFPYSVIPGGVRSEDELRASIKNDPVVAKHYAGFNLDRVRFERLQKPMLMHVSYRIGSNVFWTRRLMHIKAGETVVTDGVNCARGRCGNRLSETLGKTFIPPMEEMTEESFDTPALGTPPSIMSFLPQIASPTMPLMPPPIITAIMPTIVEGPAEWAPAPRHIFPATVSSPGTPGIVLVRAPVIPADVSVPEPSTLLMLAGGLGLLFAGRRLFIH